MTSPEPSTKQSAICTATNMDQDGAATSTPGVPFNKLPLEIQSQIANYLGKKSLFNAILVNKEWFLRLIDLLWHTASINTVFADTARIRTKSRRQHYAGKIRRICIGSGYNPSLHEELEFHSVQHLDVHGFNAADETWLVPLLKSTLRSIYVMAYCDMNIRVLDSLQNCTQLQSLTLKGLVQPFNEEKLMAYLREASSLREVMVHPGNPPHAGYGRLTARVLNALLQQGNLKKLLIYSELPKDCFGEHLSMPTQCFPPNANLLRLHIEAYSPTALVCLSTATAHLDRLELVLSDRGHYVFQYLHNFPRLSKLVLKFKLGTTRASFKLSPSHLETLCVLEKLTHLAITPTYTKGLELEWLTDTYFDSWIAHFGCLQDLELLWESNLACAALTSIARSCPRLDHCILGWRVNLYALSSLLSNGPLIPRLRTLCLLHVEVTASNSDRSILGGAAARVIVPTICTLFPNLRALLFDYPGLDLRVDSFLYSLVKIIRIVSDARNS